MRAGEAGLIVSIGQIVVEAHAVRDTILLDVVTKLFIRADDDPRPKTDGAPHYV